MDTCGWCVVAIAPQLLRHSCSFIFFSMAATAAAIAAGVVVDVDAPVLHSPQDVAHGMPVAFNASWENCVVAFCGKDSHSIAFHMVTNSTSPLSTDPTSMFQEGGHFTIACKKVNVVGSWGRAHICTLLFRYITEQLEMMKENFPIIRFVLPVDKDGKYKNGCHILDLSPPGLELALMKLLAKCDEFFRERMEVYDRHSKSSDGIYYMNYHNVLSQIDGSWDLDEVVPQIPVALRMPVADLANCKRDTLKRRHDEIEA